MNEWEKLLLCLSELLIQFFQVAQTLWKRIVALHWVYDLILLPIHLTSA